MNSFTLEPTFHRFKWVVQPLHGFRFSVDSVILAHAIRSIDVSDVVELGAGSGIISLIMYSHQIGRRFWLVEKDSLMCEALEYTVSINGLGDSFNIICDDVHDIYLPKIADVVIFNPPYYIEGTGRGGIATVGMPEVFIQKASSLVKDTGVVAYVISHHHLQYLQDVEKSNGLFLVCQIDYYTRRKHRYVRILSHHNVYIPLVGKNPLSGLRVQNFYKDGGR